jgi:hypothetical protein
MLVNARHGRSSAAALDVPVEARREAVRKVLASAMLAKSARLKDLLSYLAERSLEDPEAAIPEQEIGIAVFGRKDYSASQDNLVRVQATQLRKKLEQYFATEGAGDTAVFEIPRGSYALRFHPRMTVAAAEPRFRRWRVPALAAAGLALVLAGWFVRGVTDQARVTQPEVRRLWTQFFGNGRETHVVLADANMTMFQDFVKRTLVLREYGRQRMVQDLVEQSFQDPEMRRLITRMAGKYFVTMADVVAARKIEALGLSQIGTVRYDFARGFNVDHLMADNAVLMGNRRANPWVELFDSQLRFRYVFDDQKVAASFEDTQAPPGETRLYPTAWERASHCQVALLPNLRGTGSVLIIAGGDQSAAEAGSEFLTSDRWIHDLARRLNVPPDGLFPYFEAFLKTETFSNTAPAFKVLFCRAVQ